MPTTTRTWRISEELAAAISETAQREQVWDSDLVAFLLRNGLARIEAGKLKIPLRPPSRFRIDWSHE